jgi:hypothetical protein
MTTTFSTKSMQQVLTYPFKDPKWMEKFLVGIGLTLGSMIVPIVPGLFVTGYIYQIIHQLTVEKGELCLPEWTDWSKLLQDGFRLTAVTFLYSLPALIIGAIGFVLYFVAFIGMTAAEGSDPNSGFAIFFFLAFGIMMISMAISTLLMSVLFISMPAIIGHTVAHDSFAAGFNISGWWKVMKANLGGFAVTFLIIFGLVSVMYMLTQIFYMTIVLICFMFIVPLIAGFYISLVGAALIGQSYREGVDKLEEGNVVVPVVVVPEIPVEDVVKPRAKRTKKVE